MSELITIQEASYLLRCAPSSIHRYVRKGKLSPTKKIDGKSFFDKQEILSFKRPDAPKSKPGFNKNAQSGIGKSEFMEVVEKWQVNTKDTGSADVEIGVLTEKIKRLEVEMHQTPTEHPEFKKMRYTLLRHVGERRRLLRYLEMSDFGRYRRALALINNESRVA